MFLEIIVHTLPCLPRLRLLALASGTWGLPSIIRINSCVMWLLPKLWFSISYPSSVHLDPRCPSHLSDSWSNNGPSSSRPCPSARNATRACLATLQVLLGPSWAKPMLQLRACLVCGTYMSGGDHSLHNYMFLYHRFTRVCIRYGAACSMQLWTVSVPEEGRGTVRTNRKRPLWATI